jgi:hypothetical protein
MSRHIKVGAVDHGRRKKLTPKQIVRAIYPDAQVDFYESIPGSVFIRVGPQGEKLSALRPLARQAWADALYTINARGLQNLKLAQELAGQ